MYNASCSVLETVIKEKKGAQRGEADKAYDDMTSFEFVLVLHIMIQILGITNDLCQALQRKSQDILNAMHLVFNTKILIQKLRDEGGRICYNKCYYFETTMTSKCQTWRIIIFMGEEDSDNQKIVSLTYIIFDTMSSLLR
ncbi:hypothetical protein RND81_01G079300 [Saponaria officinalis]|uniref:Uncharacterized protein n=1 Tax=Saponaria officinalis TaxID=3572 RepID=A0AAW1NDA8_SAPOF